jgi:hypothetical protein
MLETRLGQWYALGIMNIFHRWYCRSAQWKTTVENEVVPWALEGMDLGNNVLEIGSGPGLTTDVLSP